MDKPTRLFLIIIGVITIGVSIYQYGQDKMTSAISALVIGSGLVVVALSSKNAPKKDE